MYSGGGAETLTFAHLHDEDTGIASNGPGFLTAEPAPCRQHPSEDRSKPARSGFETAVTIMRACPRGIRV